MPQFETNHAMQLLNLLKVKLENKEKEYKSFPSSGLDKLDQNFQQRKLQVEVEYWQLKNLYDEVNAVLGIKNDGNGET